MLGASAALRARATQWLAGSRAVMTPLAGSLSRLDLHMGSPEDALLPNAIGSLTGLTRLSVIAQRLVSVGAGLRQLTRLKSLSIETFELYKGFGVPVGLIEAGSIRYVHPPVFAADLEPLAQLENLTLSHAAPCLARVIEHELPRLSSLTLWAFAGCSCGDHEHGLSYPSRNILEAARDRQLASGTRAFLSRAGPTEECKDVWAAVPEEYDDDELDSLIEGHLEGPTRLAWHDEIHRRDADAGKFWAE
jgi:hypothetical protein